MTLLESQPILYRWFFAFVLTILLEAPVYILLGRKYTTTFIRAFAAGALASCITHPLLWFAWRPLFDNYLLYVISGEVAVIVIEALVIRSVIRDLPYSKALAISLIANATSYGVGILLKLAGAI